MGVMAAGAVSGIAKIAAFLAPGLGAGTIFFAMLQQFEPQVDSTLVEIWRIALTALIVAFVTMCGVVYRDMNRRIKEQSITQKDQHKENTININEIRRENAEAMRKFSAQQNRMIGILMVMSVNGDGEKVEGMVRDLLKTDPA
jgi:serine phosphatase RsbU (regulator of sigma subunit)